MKKRRIEVTVSRRRTTIHLRHQPAGAPVQPPLHQAEGLPTLATNLASAEVTELHQPQSTLLPPAILALIDWGNENHLSEVEPEAE